MRKFCITILPFLLIIIPFTSIVLPVTAIEKQIYTYRNEKTTEEGQKTKGEKPGAMTKRIGKKEKDLPIYDEGNTQHKNYNPIIPEEYHKAKFKPGKNISLPKNTLINDPFTIVYTPLENNTGQHNDFEKVNAVLDKDGVPNVGMNGIHTYFGHYYGGTNYGAFAPLVHNDKLSNGNEFIVTGEDGLSKGYRITQVIPVQMDLQYNYFYNEDAIPYLAYFGNGDDMIALLTCRWDKTIGQMDFSIGYRVW